MKVKNYREVYKISPREASIIDDYLNTSKDDEYFSENETITHTVHFPDGCQMDIKCCGVDNGPAFTEAVLFDKNGGQLAFTEPEEDYLGTWTLEHNGVTYIAVVETFGGGGA